MTTYFVRKTGNDTTGDGLSAGTAWLTINKAHDTISIGGGHTVDIGAGTFAENSGSGFLLLDRKFSAEVIFQGAGTGSTILTGASGTDVLRSNATGTANVTFKDMAINPLSGGKVFNLTSTGSSNDVRFDNVTVTCAGGSIGATSALFMSAATHPLDGLTLNNVSIDASAATNANAMLFAGTLTDLTVSGTFSYTGTGSTNCLRIDEAAGTHLWSADCSLTVAGTNTVAFWYQATASVCSLSIGVTNPFVVSASNDDAMIIAGGAGTGSRMAVTIGSNVQATGLGGLRIDGYCSDVVIQAGGIYTSTAGTSPALSVASDGTTNDIQSVTCGAVTATTAGGHGGIFGVGANNISISGGTYDGTDHSLVIKATDGTINGVRCNSASITSLLFKGATGIQCTGCRLINSQSGAYCVDFRDEAPTDADNITFTGNILEATGAAKAISVVATGVGNGIIERCNRVTANQTGDILGTAVTSLPWTPAYASYAITTNGKENCPRGSGSLVSGEASEPPLSIVYPLVF